MKTSLIIRLTLLLSLTFVGCNETKSKGLERSAHQQANNSSASFPSVRRIPNDVVCQNCRATFKLAMATRKHSQEHSYTACPVCKKDYLKKSN